MNRKSTLRLIATSAFAAPLLSALPATRAFAQSSPPVSDADRAFVAMVSQGGMYEVEASKVAQTKAVAQDVIDQSDTEVHDHTLVGNKLKTIATGLGLPFPSELNAMFAARLAHLQTLSGKDFDAAYISEMDDIHAKDVQAFANEAKSGTNPDLKAFAAETVVIVRRHIGALHAVPAPTT